MSSFDTDLPGDPHLLPGCTQGMIDHAAGVRISHLERTGLTGRIATGFVELAEELEREEFDAANCCERWEGD